MFLYATHNKHSYRKSKKDKEKLKIRTIVVRLAYLLIEILLVFMYIKPSKCVQKITNFDVKTLKKKGANI